MYDKREIQDSSQECGTGNARMTWFASLLRLFPIKLKTEGCKRWLTFRLGSIMFELDRRTTLLRCQLVRHKGHRSAPVCT
jgi:hypothetical protein